MLALLGVAILLSSAWCWGAVLVPRAWYQGPEERVVVDVAVGLAVISNVLFLIGHAGLLYPFTILSVVLLPVGVLGFRCCVHLWKRTSLPAGVSSSETSPSPFRPPSKSPPSEGGDFLPKPSPGSDKRPGHSPPTLSHVLEALVRGNTNTMPWTTWIAVTTVVALCSLSLLEALHIDLCPDRYHVVFARSFLNNHRIGFIPGSIISCYPKAVELLFVVGLLFEPESASSVIHTSFLPLSCLAMYALFRQSRGPMTANLAALWLVGQVILHKYATMGFVDLGATFFTAVALIPLCRFLKELRLRDVCMGGLFAGMAVGCKITSGPIVVLPLCLGLALTALSRWGAPAGKAWLGVLLFGLISLAVYSPWMVRNAVYSGSPFAPTLTEVFPLQPEFKRALEAFKQTHPYHTDWLLKRPYWTFRYYLEQIAYDGSSAALLLPVSVLGLLFLSPFRKSREDLFLASIVAAGFLCYVVVGPTRSSRFALPLIPLFVAAATALTGPVADRLRESMRPGFILLFALATSAVVLGGVREYRGVYLHRPFFSYRSRDAFLMQVDPAYSRAKQLNEILTTHDRVAFHGASVRWRFLKAPFSPLTYWGYNHAEFLWRQSQGEDAEETKERFRRSLHEVGITHLMVRREGQIFPPEMLEEVTSWDDAVLYRVR